MIQLRAIVVTVVGTVILVGGGITVYSLRPKPILQSSIRKQITFPVYYPSDTKTYVVVPRTLAFNSESKVLNYSVMVAGTKVVINQQAEPEVFTTKDAPVSLYQKLLDKMHQYQELDTPFGKVTLTHPEELKGGQAAVANIRGTLLFAQPEHDLTDSQWHDFFASLNLVP